MMNMGITIVCVQLQEEKMKKLLKRVCIFAAVSAMLIGSVGIVRAYEWYPDTSGGTKGKVELECYAGTNFSTKRSRCYTNGHGKIVGAYASTTIYYSLTPSGSLKTSFGSDSGDDYAVVDIKSPSNYPVKASYSCKANSHYYGSYTSSKITLNF